MNKTKRMLALCCLLLFVSAAGCSKSADYISGYQSGYALGEMSARMKGADGAKLYWEAEKAKQPKEIWIATYESNNPERVQDPKVLHEQACGIWDGMEDSMLSRGKKH